MQNRELNQWVRDLAAFPQNSGYVSYTHGDSWVSVTLISGIPSLFSDLHGFQKHMVHRYIWTYIGTHMPKQLNKETNHKVNKQISK